MKIKMKYDCFFAKINIMLLFAALVLSSCIEKANLSVSPRIVEFDSDPTEALTINIKANVEWYATVVLQLQGDEWLTIDPVEGKDNEIFSITATEIQGKGNATISIIAKENAVFAERKARIAISGEGVKTDTVLIIQAKSLDIAEEIKDVEFKKYCLREFDKDPQDGKISLKEANSVREIIVKWMGIKSLSGIEYFPKILRLECLGNEIKNINLSKNTELRMLDCSYNPMEEQIDVSGLTKLTDLTIFEIGLTHIDVSKNLSLQYLGVSNNQITSIDVSNNKELKWLSCNYNKLTSIDVSKNINLQSLSCDSNQLRMIDVSKNTKLVYLYCNRNLLTDINLSQNTALQIFSCSSNRLFTNLDVRNNINLVELLCENTQLSTIDISENINLKVLKCNTKLSGSIDISNNVPRPDDGYTGLMYLNLKRNPALTAIYVWEGFDKLNRFYEVDDIKLYQEK